MGSHVGNDEDKISQLPDALLSHMLSFLLTKDAVRTSILSKRWKNIWASVPSLDFEHYSCAGFVSFVDRVLYYRDSLDIQRFRLHFKCFPIDVSSIDRWIRTATSHNVVELDLCLNFLGGVEFEVPESVFECKTLVVLKLKSDSSFTYAPPKLGCFPNLKCLHITIDYPDKDLLEKLFSYFPVLEDLSVEGEWNDHVNCNVKLFVPKLKRLSINIHSTGYFDEPYEYYFSIDAPKLEFLDLRVDILPSMSFDNSKSLVKAIVGFYYHPAIMQEHFCDRATKILAPVSNVEHLSLSAHFLDASCIPAFGNLIHLKLVLHDCYRWEVLAELLKKSPNLECLVLEHEQDNNCYPENSEDEENAVDQENTEDPWWNCEESAPRCLLSHLKTVLIRGFMGCRDEKQAAKYLLKNGAVLEEMTIYVDNVLYSREKLCMEFAHFQRGSMTCRLQLV
uniref:FBD-associated F-box protein At4g10400-like n=1 Tax=Fragaria vesca subsp. vesca TaxID=101020 RepID=UPI0005C7FCD5|nr:PREDICTED: FBD-associated F-box protein At4g10400-like [Fragaria vesca subsp. vesca]XP_011459598.1 PREDICTED: FBD-associated F-box protein At4g10400-like [Fragaria vesca subsp. vesca]XP_011459600.1 PREDICTED: FBD-associated F-box protein At4g10400-like [Fragaria vesca subsp. vesca]